MLLRSLLGISGVCLWLSPAFSLDSQLEYLDAPYQLIFDTDFSELNLEAPKPTPEVLTPKSDSDSEEEDSPSLSNSEKSSLVIALQNFSALEKKRQEDEKSYLFWTSFGLAHYKGQSLEVKLSDFDDQFGWDRTDLLQHTFSFHTSDSFVNLDQPLWFFSKDNLLHEVFRDSGIHPINLTMDKTSLCVSLKKRCGGLETNKEIGISMAKLKEYLNKTHDPAFSLHFDAEDNKIFMPLPINERRENVVDDKDAKTAVVRSLRFYFPQIPSKIDLTGNISYLDQWGDSADTLRQDITSRVQFSLNPPLIFNPTENHLESLDKIAGTPPMEMDYDEEITLKLHDREGEYADFSLTKGDLLWALKLGGSQHTLNFLVDFAATKPYYLANLEAHPKELPDTFNS